MTSFQDTPFGVHHCMPIKRYLVTRGRRGVLKGGIHWPLYSNRLKFSRMHAGGLDSKPSIVNWISVKMSRVHASFRENELGPVKGLANMINNCLNFGQETPGMAWCLKRTTMEKIRGRLMAEWQTFALVSTLLLGDSITFLVTSFTSVSDMSTTSTSDALFALIGLSISDHFSFPRLSWCKWRFCSMNRYRGSLKALACSSYLMKAPLV